MILCETEWLGDLAANKESKRTLMAARHHKMRGLRVRRNKTYSTNFFRNIGASADLEPNKKK